MEYVCAITLGLSAYVQQALLQAAISYDLRESFRLLCLGADPNWYDVHTRYTALHIAAAAGNQLLAELLLIRGTHHAFQSNLTVS